MVQSAVFRNCGWWVAFSDHGATSWWHLVAAPPYSLSFERRAAAEQRTAPHRKWVGARNSSIWVSPDGGGGFCNKVQTSILEVGTDSFLADGKSEHGGQQAAMLKLLKIWRLHSLGAPIYIHAGQYTSYLLQESPKIIFTSHCTIAIYTIREWEES